MKNVCKKILIIICILVMVITYLPSISFVVFATNDKNDNELEDNDIGNNIEQQEPEENEEPTIEFANDKIKEYLSENCDFDGNNKITESDMLQIENLDFWNLEQEDIDFTGLEYAKNLKTLQINNPGIKISNPNNIQVFKEFSKLEKLSLRFDYNCNQDISSIINNLTSLKILDIWYADFTNLDFSKLENLEELSIGGVRLTNIKQISCLKNLKKLTLYNYTGLTDFENIPICNLTDLVLSNADITKMNFNLNENKLTRLSLDNCKINDLSFLENKTNLENLSLNSNNIEDITSISNLKKLKNLYLNSNKIENISALQYLEDLQDIYLCNNYIKDISAIGNLENLQFIDLSQNPINPNLETNASIIQSLRDNGKCIIIDAIDESQVITFNDDNLKNAIIKSGNDRDKNGEITINEMQQMYYLSAGDYKTPITDISELKYATNLSSLYINLNSSDISALKDLLKLTNLSITNHGENKVIDITAIEDLTELQYLSLGETNVDNISSLENLKKLTGLSIYSNRSNNPNTVYVEGIKDISVVANFNKLENLSITGQSIEDISVIKNLENLKSISLNDNKIYDISSMEEWKCLDKVTSIGLSKNNIKDISKMPNIINKMTNIKDFYLGENNFEDINVIKQLKTLPNFSCLKFGGTKHVINLGKIDLNSEQKINLPNVFNQVEEIYDELEWNISISNMDDYNEDLNNNLVGNVYNLDTSHIGKQEIRIQKYGNRKDHNYIPYEINSVEIVINFVIETEGDKNKIITFKDENLNKVLLAKYDIDEDKKITENDILNLTRLDLNNSNITDLSGIEQATNLRYIEAYSNKIRDISPLMQLENLTFAELYDNEITDITCLKDRKFKHIYAIGVEHNYIDFSNNSENTQTYLNEWEKEVEEYGEHKIYLAGKELLCSFASGQKYGLPEDMDKVVNMDDKIKQAIIEQLEADTNNDGQLTRKELYSVQNWVYKNENGNYSSRQNSLNLSNLDLTNISGIEYLSNISKLDISNNKISNIEPLTHLNNLSELNAANNYIKGIKVLPYYKYNSSLKYNFANNEISDISCLENWVGCKCNVWIGWRAGGDPNLRTCEFDFSNNNIEDITAVKNLKCLIYMNLNNNKITDISALKDYDFVLNLGGEGTEMYEQLGDFKGISLKANNINSEEIGNKAAIEVFKNKGVSLLLDPIMETIHIVDENTNVQISTVGEKTAKIQVQTIEESSIEYKEIVNEIPNYEILYSADISIIEGEHKGKITITIPVEEKFNNKFVKILHIKENGTIEEFIKKVKNSSVEVEVNELSPFFVAYNETLLPQGDVNGDGKVNGKDWIRLYEHISETNELIGEELKRADVNGDGKVNGKDWIRLYEHISETNLLW